MNRWTGSFSGGRAMGPTTVRWRLMSEQSPKRTVKDPEWTAREMEQDLLRAPGYGRIRLPYHNHELPEEGAVVGITVSLSARDSRVLLGTGYERDDARVGAAARLSPDQARELAHDLEQAAIRMGETDG